MDGLRQKLESQGLRDVTYMVINHQGEQAQRLHTTLAQRLSESITLYKQDELQPDVWQTLGGEKDDFFIYDRCGRLTHHISLPYSIIGQGHVEVAIKDAYCKRMCGDCTHESAEIPEECKGKADAQPDAVAAPAVEEDTGHGHGHGHHHGHPHGHDHAHHGDNHGFHPRGFGHGDGQHHGHHHGNHHGNHDNHDHGQSQTHQDLRPQGQQQNSQVFQRQQHAELGQMQQAVHMLQMRQEAHAAPVMP